ncbi:MAG: response regulator transcription factor [SAR324 cluster bacterium]|nr:response regulator transcription factor [SAR324 cluster bacterium]
MSLRLVIADNHPIIRSGIRMLFQQAHGFEIVGEAEDGLDAMQLCEQLSPDLVMLDVSMPKMNGIEAARVIKEKCPDTKIAIFSSYTNPEYITYAFEAGASAYLLKDEDMDKLPPILRAIANGETYVSQEAKDSVTAYQVDMKKQASLESLLTTREKQILQRIVDGKTTKEIAYELDISARTAETHKYNIMQKLNTHDIATLVRFAIAHQLVSVTTE